MTYKTSREPDDLRQTNILRDVAFNRHSMSSGAHDSPYDNRTIQIGADGIIVELVQGIDEENFAKTLSMAQQALSGVDLNDKNRDYGDWEEMLEGGLQTALETQTVVFAVQGVSRICTHQLVRSRRAAFHQQSQRAGFYGNHPESRMPESVWLNPRARAAYLEAKAASDKAYQIACDEDISYQDARYALLESTTNFILLEYSIREFLNVFAYRGCSMFSWEIVSVMRQCRQLLVDKYPWLKPHIKISCEKVGKCTYQGWEKVEGQCDFPWAKEDNRTFRSKLHEIG